MKDNLVYKSMPKVSTEHPTQRVLLDGRSIGFIRRYGPGDWANCMPNECPQVDCNWMRAYSSQKDAVARLVRHDFLTTEVGQ